MLSRAAARFCCRERTIVDQSHLERQVQPGQGARSQPFPSWASALIQIIGPTSQPMASTLVMASIAKCCGRWVRAVSKSALHLFISLAKPKAGGGGEGRLRSQIPLLLADTAMRQHRIPSLLYLPPSVAFSMVLSSDFWEGDDAVGVWKSISSTRWRRGEWDIFKKYFRE